MPRDKSTEAHDRTPLTRLVEGGLHGVVGYQLAQASIVTTQVFDAALGRAGTLRPVEYTVLALVDGNPGVTARQLSRGLAMSPPNVTVCLDRLAARGLVLRSRGTADARVQHISTTAAGAKLAAQATERLLEGERHALAVLSAAERAMLVELLHKLAMARKRSGPAA